MQVSKITTATIPASTPASESKLSKSKFAEALYEIEKGEDRLNKAIERAMRGKDLSPQELIALQAGVYHYTHKLEIFSKLVDRATSSIRQLMNP